jgi:hypothetical protein
MPMQMAAAKKVQQTKERKVAAAAKCGESMHA